MAVQSSTRLIRIVAGVVLGIAVGLGARYLLVPEVPTLQPIAIGGPFSLIDQNGQRRTQADFRGKLMLVTFGYTYCPDVCPLDLQLMTDALDRLGPAAEKIQPVFISVDPERDTPAQLKDYVAHFSPRLIGLTGSEADVAAAAKAFRVFFKVNKDPAKGNDYTVDHSAFIYLMAADGSFLTHFTHDTAPEKMAAALRQYL